MKNHLGEVEIGMFCMPDESEDQNNDNNDSPSLGDGPDPKKEEK